MNTNISSNANARGKLVLGYINADGSARPEDFVVVRARKGMPPDAALKEAITAVKKARLDKYLAEKKAAAGATVKTSAPTVRKTKAKKAAKKASQVRQRGMRVDYPDGTVWYRADRKLWVAQMARRQEAARPSAEAAVAFLKKKYPNVKPVIIGTVTH